MISGENTSFIMCYRNRYVLWGGSDAVLNILDLEVFHRDRTINIRKFSIYDGFDAFECGQNGGFIDHEGYVWLVVGHQALKFNPETLMQEPIAKTPLPHIAIIQSSSINSDWTVAREGKDIILDNNCNNLLFSLFQASMVNPDKLQIRYRLKGYTDKWMIAASREIEYQNLPHGLFRLEVQASLDGKNWTESVFSRIILIKRPFLLTVGGLVLSGVVILFVLYILLLIIRKFIHNKVAQQRRVEELRYHAVVSKFIPHFTGNVLNSINYLISVNPEAAQKYIANFAQFTSSALKSTEKMFWSIGEEVSQTENYLQLEKLRHGERFEYSIEIDPAVDLNTEVPRMMLHTFCGNSFKHGFSHKESGKNEIRIRIFRDGKDTVVSEEDNGIGRLKASEYQTGGTREGLKIIAEQLQLRSNKNGFKGSMRITDLFDEAGKAAGTRCEVRIWHED